MILQFKLIITKEEDLLKWERVIELLKFYSIFLGGAEEGVGVISGHLKISTSCNNPHRGKTSTIKN